MLAGLTDAQRIFEYLDAVREDPAFETTALPLGGGITVSPKTGE